MFLCLSGVSVWFGIFYLVHFHSQPTPCTITFNWNKGLYIRPVVAHLNQLTTAANPEKVSMKASGRRFEGEDSILKNLNFSKSDCMKTF